MFFSHLVEDLHKGGDQAVDVTLVVHAGCLQDYKGAESWVGDPLVDLKTEMEVWDIWFDCIFFPLKSHIIKCIRTK